MSQRKSVKSTQKTIPFFSPISSIDYIYIFLFVNLIFVLLLLSIVKKKQQQQRTLKFNNDILKCKSQFLYPVQQQQQKLTHK